MEGSHSKNQEKYLNYLKKLQRKDHESLKKLHKRYLSREVAIEYGLTEEEMQRMDNELQKHGDEK